MKPFSFNARTFREFKILTDTPEKLSLAVEERTQMLVLLRYGATEQQVERAQMLATLNLPQVPQPLGQVELETHERVLVLAPPEQGSHYFPLAPDVMPFTDSKVIAIGKSILSCINTLSGHGCYLKVVFPEDVIVSPSLRAYLVNTENVAFIQGERPNRAEASVAKILMQLSLNCSFDVVSACIQRGQDGRYRLHRIPKGLSPKVRAFVETLLPSTRSRIARTWGRWLAIAVCAPAFVAGVLVGISKCIPQETSSAPPDFSELVEGFSIVYRYLGCISALDNKTPGSCRGVNLSGGNFRGMDFREIDLHEVIFREADLMGANLSGMTLNGTNFDGANLQNADLSGITLDGTNFDGANLRNADLSRITARSVVWCRADLMNATLKGANLRSADFSETRLGEVDLSGADISFANLSGVNLSNQTLSALTAVETVFDEAYLTGVTLDGGEYVRASFNGADMTGSVFTNGVMIDESEFDWVELEASRFMGATIVSSTFYASELRDVVIDGSRLSGTQFIGSSLFKSKITNSVLVGGSFRDSDLRLGVIQDSSVEVMDFDGVKGRSLEIINSDLSRSSNLPVYFFFSVKYRNVIMPDGEVRNPD